MLSNLCDILIRLIEIFRLSWLLGRLWCRRLSCRCVRRCRIVGLVVRRLIMMYPVVRMMLMCVRLDFCAWVSWSSVVW